MIRDIEINFGYEETQTGRCIINRIPLKGLFHPFQYIPFFFPALYREKRKDKQKAKKQKAKARTPPIWLADVSVCVI